MGLTKIGILKKDIVRMSKLKIDQKGLMEMVRVGRIVWVQEITKIGF